MTKQKYKVLAKTGFRGHQQGDEFEADLTEDEERRANRARLDPRRQDRSRRRRRRMPKRVALKDSVEVDSADLSNFARAVDVHE